VANECVVGLDIGTTKICAVVAEIDDNGKVKIVGSGSVPSAGLRRGVVIDIDEAAAAIEKAVEAAHEATSYEIHSVVVGVTGDHIASLNSKGILAVTHATREITQEDVDKVVEQSRVIVLPPDREIIHVIPRSFTVDGQSHVRYPVGMAGVRLEVESHVVTGGVTLLQNLAKAVNKAGLSVESAVLESIASAEAVLTPAEKNLGVALLDIGGGTTESAVFVDGDIAYSGSVPIGGALVTRDISIGLRVTPEEAERIKLTYGTAVYSGSGGGDYDTFEVTGVDGKTRSVTRRHLSDIIGPRMEEIFTLANQKIEKSGYYNYLLAGIVLTGGGSLLPAATTYCSDITGLSARIGAPDDILYLPEQLSTVVHATGLGLALHAARRPRAVFARKISNEPVTTQIGQHVESCIRKLQAFFAKIMGAKSQE
jgi:cell division protein FtsA